MKRKLCILTALLCLLTVTVAFAFTLSLAKGTAVYKNPGYYSEIAQKLKEKGTFTIVEETVDAYGNRWGKLKSGAGWVALSAEDYPITLYAGDQIYAGPGYDFDLTQTLTKEGSYTIVAQAWDTQDNLWGQLKSGAGWVFLRSASAMIYHPIIADFASEELIAKGPYEYLAVDPSEYSTELAIYANEVLTDVSFYECLHNDGGCEEKLLYVLPTLTVEKPLVACVVFYGDMTTYGVSFTDGAGVRHSYEMYISGMDGSLILTKCDLAHQ